MTRILPLPKSVQRGQGRRMNLSKVFAPFDHHQTLGFTPLNSALSFLSHLSPELRAGVYFVDGNVYS